MVSLFCVAAYFFVEPDFLPDDCGVVVALGEKFDAAAYLGSGAPREAEQRSLGEQANLFVALR